MDDRVRCGVGLAEVTHAPGMVRLRCDPVASHGAIELTLDADQARALAWVLSRAAGKAEGM